MSGGATDGRIGLLVPCRNGARFLPRLMAAARAQTRPFDEAWVFDDGSSDDSGKVAADLGARVIRSDHSLGPSAARNRLAQSCGCEWLHFHDADDTLAPTYLARTSQECRPGVDIVVCDMAWTEETPSGDGQTWLYRYDPAAFPRHPVASLVGNTVGGINGLYRRETFVAAGGFDESLFYWEDMDLNIRLAQRGARTVIVPEILVTAYRHTDSHCAGNPGEVWRVKLALLSRLLPGADEVLLGAIAADAEETARRLGTLGLWAEAGRAVDLSVQAGGRPPSTRSRLLRAIKPFLSPIGALRLQHRFHRFLQLGEGSRRRRNRA